MIKMKPISNHSEPHQAKVPLRAALQVKLQNDLSKLRSKEDATSSQDIGEQARLLSKQLCFGQRLGARNGQHELEPVTWRHHELTVTEY